MEMGVPMSSCMENSKELNVRVFTGREGLLAIEEIWNNFVSGIPNMRFIHQYGWYRSHLEAARPENGTVVFVLMLRAGAPVAIFPLLRSVVRRFGIRLRTWEILWPNDMGICDFVFAKTDGNRELLTALTRFLRTERGFAWDLLRLEDTLDDSCVQYSLRAAPPPLAVTFKHHSSKYIPCDGNYESVMGRLSGDFRRNLRRQTKKLCEMGNVEFRFVTEPKDMEEAFWHFLHAEATSWKGGTGSKSAIQLHDDRIRFYRTLIDEFSRQGACAINLILLNGQCIASQLGVSTGDTLYLLKIGYNEEHKALGPGNVLLGKVIERCCGDSKISKISFITGAAWNDRWAPEAMDVLESNVYNFTFPGISAYTLEWAKNRGRRLKHWGQALMRTRKGTDAGAGS